MIHKVLKKKADDKSKEKFKHNPAFPKRKPDPSKEHEALETSKEEKTEHMTGMEAMDEKTVKKRKYKAEMMDMGKE